MKKCIFVIIVMFIFSIEVKADCSYNDIAKYKSYISNVTTTYDYRIEGTRAYFDVTVSNIPNNVYMLDISTGNTYNDFVNNEITINNYSMDKITYKFYYNDCENTYLGSKYIIFPNYNPYSTEELCKGIEDYKMCQKWLDNNYSYEQFVEEIEKYKKSLEPKEIEDNIVYERSLIDKIVNFYINNYYYLLGTIVVIGLTFIIIIKRKTNVDLKI